MTVQLKKQFAAFAAKTDEDGLHQEDMRHLLAHIGLCYSPAAFKAKFEAADADKGGFLDRGEFLGFFFEMVTGKDPLPYETTGPDAGEDEDGGDDDDDEDEDGGDDDD